jgi:hypothetical protein
MTPLPSIPKIQQPHRSTPARIEAKVEEEKKKKERKKKMQPRRPHRTAPLRRCYQIRQQPSHVNPRR